MKLNLENFRCYRQQTFELPTVGLTLLHGDSGKGKTSIFKAINFALFGKEQKTTTFGARKSRVELVLDDDCTIVRTRTPNHLMVKTKDFEAADGAAQAWIDKRFGDHFLQTSYLSQKCLDNFFTQKREERAVILRSLSIQSFDIDALKAKNKEHVKQRKLVLQKVSNDFRWLTDEIRQRGFTDVMACPVFPLSDTKDFEGAIKEDQRQQENNWKKLVAAQETLKELNVRLQDVMVRTSEKFVLEKRLSDLETQLTELRVTCEEVISVDEAPVKQCRDLLTQLELAQTLETKKAEHQKALLDHEKVREAQLKQLEDQIAANDYDEREMQSIVDEMKYIAQAMKATDEITKLCSGGVVKLDLSRFLASLEDAKDLSRWTSRPHAIEELADLQQQYDQTKAKIRQLKDHNRCVVQQCPSCRHSLIIVDRSGGGHEVRSHNAEVIREELAALESSQRALKTKIDELVPLAEKAKLVKEKLQRLVSLMSLYDGYIEEDVTSLADDWKRVNREHKEKEIAREQLTVLKQQVQTAKTSTSDVARYLESEIKSIQKRLVVADLSSCADVASEIAVCRQNLRLYEDQLANNKYRLQQQRERRSRMQEVQAEIEQQRGLLDSIAVDKVDELRVRINDLNVEVENRRQKAERFDKRKTQIEKWRIDYAKYEEYVRLSKKMEVTRQEMAVAERALRVALQLGKYIQDAESQAMQSFLQQLNEECNKHMEVMFDGDLTMKVVYEAEDENKKYFVDVLLTRDNDEISFDSLSGGESDRCALAVFLAFNKLSKSKFLLLDECLSSLHAESVETIVDHIKAHFKDTMCVMTLHQTTTGIFDHVIQLD